ncbi:MAG: AMP-binding protein, partial [Ruminococcus sp.]|nr:AMP-binding protein [Ruminococcus sp.]
MKDFYKRFVKEELDAEGRLVSFALDIKDDFNFSYDVVDELGRLEPDKTAILWVGENGEEHRFSYKDMMDESSRVANMMLAHGVKKGDFVLAVLKRHYEFWFLAYGLMKIGAILVPATNQLTTKDYIYRFKAADISYVVATGENGVSENIDAALKVYGGIKEKFITHGKREGWTDFLTETAKYSPVRERIETHVTEPMLMYFSSGTTGYPKMVLHNYSIAAAHILTGKHWHHLDENSLHLTVSETGWAKCAWGKMFGQYVAGATSFIYDFDRFDPDKLMKMIQDYRITSFCAPPTMYRFFIKAGISKYDLSSIKYSCIAGEALNPIVYRRWFESTGLKLMEGFGQTESAVILGNLYGMEPKAGSMGKPTPLYKVALMDSDGELTPQGEVGEIVVYGEEGKTPGLLKEYYRNPAENERAWKYG